MGQQIPKLKDCIKCHRSLLIRWHKGPTCGKCYQKTRAYKFTCKSCGSNKSAQWYSHPDGHECTNCHRKLNDRHSFTLSKWKAKNRGIVWELDFDNYIEILEDNRCFYCFGELTESGVRLDRKDSNQGYTAENVVPCCGSCNKVKSDVLTSEEMSVAMAAVLKLRKKI